MSKYDYLCKGCDTVWEEDFPFAKASKIIPCPKCEEKCPRYYGDQIPTIHFDRNDTDFNSVKASRRKAPVQDFKEWQEIEKKKSIERQNEGWRHYSEMKIDHEYWAKQGVARYMSDKENSERTESCRRMMRDHYDSSNLKASDLVLDKPNITQGTTNVDRSQG
jgi:hypothetical protein